ncbi:MAG: hypothetical protein JRF33_19815 [Deltaproteobacteria bacterium]|nr:hypothetical protein [Deltaproteobacteria bacterium]
MKKFAMLYILVFLAFTGCNSGESGPIEGHEGGKCTVDGLCLQGLTCVADVCVKPESLSPAIRGPRTATAIWKTAAKRNWER